MAQRTCSIDGCGMPFYGREWCRLHWKRWYRHGDPLHQRADPDRVCKVDGCDRRLADQKACGFGMCGMHYKRWKKHGDPNYVRVRPKIQGVAPCSIEGCDKVVMARGWCSAHYSRWVRHGSPMARLRGEVVNGKRVCPRCNEDLPTAAFTKYRAWCESCALAYHAEKRTPYVSRKVNDAVCDHCGSNFLADSRRWRFCSPECSGAGKNAANWPHMVARRARLAAAYDETFDRFEIFERDDWTCGICQQSVDPEAEWPDPMSPSIDHVIPISKGGRHARDNVQCAHLVCNTRKGTMLVT